jgi:hypothetical protein
MDPLGLALAAALWLRPGPAAPLEAAVEAAPACARDGGHGVAEPGRFVAAAVCGTCHERAHEEHALSRHAAAGTDPAFLAELSRVLDERGSADPCLRCHAPTTALARGTSSVAPEALERLDLPGVTCEVCHAAVGHLGNEPGGGNLVTCPGEAGSIGRGHAAVGSFQQGSEACAVCHQWSNDHGVTVMDTHREWSRSPAAAEGFACQDCHASAAGFLVEGRVVEPGGRVVSGPGLRSTRARAALHSHEHPGGSWPVQLRAALELDLRLLPETAEGRVGLEVVACNEGAGHAVPTGWTALRLVWLEVEADGVPVRLPALDPGRPWDEAGAVPGDPLVDGSGVPRGSRLYRSVFVDSAGRPTTQPWAATALAFDNRIGPGEARRERILLEAGGGAGRRITARLLYRSRPGSWSARRGLADEGATLLVERSLALPDS